MGNPFSSFRNVPIIGEADKPKPMTKEEMAADLAEECVLELKEMRAAALKAEANCEPSLPPSPRQRELYTTLEALLKGPHRWVVVPVILEHLPELATPATPEEQALVDQYLAEKAKADGDKG